MIHQDDPPLLRVRDLKVHFPGPSSWRKRRAIRAVDGVNLQVRAGETLGIVGESGCGKTTMARAILRLTPVTGGSIEFDGKRIDRLSASRMLPIRRDLQMIFQDPFASLNPRMTVGNIVAEPMQIFRLYPSRQRKLEVMRLLEMVGLNPRYLNRYPHEFSGGQRQRIGIARALAVQPRLIVCDEPVSALDVSIQAQVINLLKELQQRLNLAYIFIAHDLAVVRHISDRVGVMYMGRLVEVAPAAELYASPLHPYTQALLSAVPLPDPTANRDRQRIALQGEVPSLEQGYSGCPFADRCPIVEPACFGTEPDLEGRTHQTACLKVNSYS